QLGEGTLTLSSTVTDSVGNTGATKAVAAVLDSGAPSGYSVAISEDPINSNNATATSFTITDGELGDTYNYTFADNSGGTVSSSGTLGANSTISGIDVSRLVDGVITLSLTMSDPGGNSGVVVEDSVMKDVVAPSGYSVVFATDQYSTNNGDAGSFTVSNAIVGTTLSYEVSSNNGGSPLQDSFVVNNTTEVVDNLNLLQLADGELKVVVTLTDENGNTGLADSATTELDAAAPAGFTVSLSPNPIDGSTAPNVTLTIDNGSIDDAYVFSIASSGGGDPITGSGTMIAQSESITGLNLSNLEDGTITATVTLTDLNGNVGETITGTAIKDSGGPTGWSVAFTTGEINLLNNTQVGFQFTNAELNATYEYSLVSSGDETDTLFGSGLVTSSALSIGGINVAGLQEGTLTLNVRLTDENGNAGNAQSTTAVYNKNPEVVTGTVTEVLINGATFTGIVDGQGATTTFVQFEVATSSDFANSQLLPGAPIELLNVEEESVTVDVDGLEEDTNYFVRITATNGNGARVRGNTETFTTLLDLEPSLADISETSPEDSVFTFTFEMFDDPFFSPEGSPLSAITIESLPTSGTLNLGSSAVTLNQEITASNIQNLTYTPNTDFFGDDSFRWNAEAVDILAINDAEFNLSISAVNDGPTISAIDIQSGKENEPISGVDFTILDVDNDADDLQVTFSSSDILVIDPTGIVMTGSDENRSLTLNSSEAQGYGESEITVTVSDGELEASTTFTVIFGITKREPVIYDLFTPNGDGVNDLWIIENLQSYDSYQIVAFDPETQTQLFSLAGEGTGNLGDSIEFWDGTSNGVAVADGAYGYVIIATYEGATEKFTGFVVVQRDFFND
ncbi:MAG: gliding motility-associated C-terminal domain-containing protein, partial [Bacteroidota bacterium]